MAYRAKDTERVIERMVEAIKKDYRPEKIILFGSYAWGAPSKDSDIDLLIVKNTKKTFFKRLLDVRRIVAEARRGRGFEPIVVTPAELKERLDRRDAFFEEIVLQGKKLYGV